MKTTKGDKKWIKNICFGLMTETKISIIKLIVMNTIISSIVTLTYFFILNRG